MKRAEEEKLIPVLEEVKADRDRLLARLDISEHEGMAWMDRAEKAEAEAAALRARVEELEAGIARIRVWLTSRALDAADAMKSDKHSESFLQMEKLTRELLQSAALRPTKEAEE